MYIYNHVAIEWIAIIMSSDSKNLNQKKNKKITSVCAANEAKAACCKLKSREYVVFD